ncbi:MAG: fused MFS/spermidine synthase [Steroidobacteraceae bacterium]
MSVEGSALPVATLRASAGSRERAAIYWPVGLFFVSGMAALLYQVCWQRLLFQSVGVDLQSVTIIVSTFMFGLGLGALAGGELADCYPERTLALFALIELVTGAFGAASPWLLRAVGAATVHCSVAVISLVNFGLLLIPTTLMGATLPILVTHVVRTFRNLGVSVGVLYFSNTLGAALGAFLTGFLVLYYCGLTATIWIAAALNVAVSVLVWLTMRGERV